jgi:hypothetical protein
LLRTSATKNGAPFGLPPGNTLADLPLAGRNDFRVDSFAVISYSDAIQTGPPAFHGSVLAHGTVDNVQVIVPPPPVSNLRMSFTNAAWQAQFTSTTHWAYTLERSENLVAWTPSSSTAAGNGSTLSLQDTNLTAPQMFYRIRAERP